MAGAIKPRSTKKGNTMNYKQNAIVAAAVDDISEKINETLTEYCNEAAGLIIDKILGHLRDENNSVSDMHGELVQIIWNEVLKELQ